MKMKSRVLVHAMKWTVMIMVLVFLSNSCMLKPGAVATDETPTRGKISIAIDESFQLLFDTEVYTFCSLYKDAQIHPEYLNEQVVLDRFFSDSVNNMVLTRELKPDEVSFLSQKNLVPRTTKIAHDALAIILNPANKDTLLELNKVKELFTGKISDWKQIDKKSDLGKIKIVFDNIKSGNVRYFIEKFDLKDSLPNTFASVNNNFEVIKYVKNHAGAVGVLSVNWISDRQDSTSIEFLSEVKVAAITPDFDPNGTDYYKPYQAYIADGSYPFARDVFYISKESFSGLGTGFASFVAGDQGQRIVLKSKLVPATMPVRIIHLK